MKTLFVGNSYTFFNRMPHALEALALERQVALETLEYLRGGASFQTHWRDNLGLTEERDMFCPELQTDRVGGLDRLLQAQPDVTVLQGQSMDPIVQPESFYHHAALLAQRIHEAGCPRIVFFMTWARQGKPEQQMIITGAYRKIASELAADLAPVGQAWADVGASLPDAPLHRDDQSHPTPTGSYLSACVLLETLTGKSCLGLAARIESVRDEDGRIIYDLDPSRALALQQIAHGVVEDFAKDC